MSKHELQPLIDEAVKEHIPKLASNRLIDRVLRVMGIMTAIGTIVTMIWCTGRLVFSMGMMWNDYKTNSVSWIKNVRVTDSLALMIFTLRNDVDELSSEDSTQFAIYNKFIVLGEALTQEERNKIRAAYNNSIKTN